MFKLLKNVIFKLLIYNFQIFLKEKKEKEEQIAEEITITHTTNYYNDSLANQYDNNEEEEENDEKQNEESEEEEDEEDNNEGQNVETINIEPITNQQKKENNNQKNNIKDIHNKVNTNNEKESQGNNFINEDKEEKENKSNNLNQKGDFEDKKVKIDLNDDDISNDKISFCHLILQKGLDVNINTKKNLFFCYENMKNKTFFSSKKYKNVQSILFIDEHYLYILKNAAINKNNGNLRRISDIFDLNKLFDYTINQYKNDYEFCLDFLIEDNFLDRKKKYILFEEKEAEIFENYLLDTLEKIDSIYINENNRENEEEEENGEKIEDKNNKINEEEKKEDKNKKKIFLRNTYGIGERKESYDAKSSSRFIYKNIYV